MNWPRNTSPRVRPTCFPASRSSIDRTRAGDLLYSGQADDIDDGGRLYDDDPPGDDIGVRMPLPEVEARTGR